MSRLAIIELEKHTYNYKGFCLRIPSADIEQNDFKSEWLKNLVFDMFDTLYSRASGVGLAANQVGVLKRICIIDIKRDGKNPLVLINPKYSPVNDEQEISQEVCLSFPNISSSVPRYKKIQIEYQDFNGDIQTENAEGFKAKVFQHEIDHLNGIVHIDKTEDPFTDYSGYSAKLAKQALESLTKVSD